MKKLFYILAAALMVLTSVSCSKNMVPLYLKGTTWVFEGTDGVSVLKFDTRRTFHVDVYDTHDGVEYLATVNYRVAEVMDDDVYFEFASISIVESGDGVAQEGIITLHGRRNMEIVTTKNRWREIDESSRFQLYRDDNFNISNYVER